MTLHEVIGVKYGNIDAETGKPLTHSEVYGRAIDLLGGLDTVKAFIPFSLELLRKRYKEDPYLNNTPLNKWDRAAGFESRPFTGKCLFCGGGIWHLYFQHEINSASCSDGVCLLKEAARRLVEREEKQ